MKSLVTGGARSGKSRFAEKLCMTRAPRAKYIATAQAFDEEMRERIDLHRRRRMEAAYPWDMLEEPHGLPLLLAKLSREASEVDTGRKDHHNEGANPHSSIVLVDCLTLWLSNVLLAAEEDGEAVAKGAIHRLADAIEQYEGPLILVTNEVGDGIVPEYPLGRIYRDLSGIMNQRIASVCDELFLVTAGIAVEMKQREYKL